MSVAKSWRCPVCKATVPAQYVLPPLPPKHVHDGKTLELVASGRRNGLRRAQR